MYKFMPIKDLKNTSEISEMCHVAEEPIYITKNGYGDMVTMSIEMYENTMKKLNMYNELALSETEIEKGETIDARQSLGKLRDKYAL